MAPKNLRIAFVTMEYVTENYFDGGLANYLHRTTTALARLGHDVHVVTLSEIDRAKFEHEGVTVHRIMNGRTWPQLNRFTRYRFSNSIRLLNLSVQFYSKLRELNSQLPFHLVQYPNACCSLLSIYFLKAPHVLRLSSYRPIWNKTAGLKHNLDAKTVDCLENLQYRLSPHLIAPSYTLQRHMAADSGIDRVRVIRTPFYIETEDWDDSVYDRLLKGKKYLLFFGRVQFRKGVHVLARALPRFLERYPEASVVIIGRDMWSTLAPSMADYVRSVCHHWAERLVLMDRLPHSQLYPIVAGAHLVVLPSLMDNLSNACLEAMGLGKPVIGTAGASFEELISDGETGFLVPPNDVDALSEKIISAWTDPRLDEIGQAARRRILEFSPEKTIEALVSYYREVLDGPPVARDEIESALPQESFDPTP